MSLSLDPGSPTLDAPEISSSDPSLGPRSLPTPEDASKALEASLEDVAGDPSVLMAAAAIQTSGATGDTVYGSSLEYAEAVIEKYSERNGLGLSAADKVQDAVRYLGGHGALPEVDLGALPTKVDPDLDLEKNATNDRPWRLLSPLVVLGEGYDGYPNLPTERRVELGREAAWHLDIMSGDDTHIVPGDFVDPGFGAAGGANVPILDARFVPSLTVDDLSIIVKRLEDRSDRRVDEGTSREAADEESRYIFNVLTVAYSNQMLHVDLDGLNASQRVQFGEMFGASGPQGQGTFSEFTTKWRETFGWGNQ